MVSGLTNHLNIGYTLSMATRVKFGYIDQIVKRLAQKVVCEDGEVVWLGGSQKVNGGKLGDYVRVQSIGWAGWKGQKV